MAAPVLLKTPMLRHRRSRHAQRGFTFIELLVTMTIFSIVCAMAVPNFRQLGAPYAVRQAASQVAADFQATRMRAIARNTSYRFTYNSSTKTYQMQRLQGGSWVTERSSTLPQGVEVGSVGTPPVINSRGMLAANVSIPLSANGHTKTVTVNVLGQTTIS
jgi:prepilin-type N-terminal cleavage/methylation domain-containing protein